MKADFFRTLGHPARIRILELLSDGDRSVADMLPEVGVGATNMSQHLAVLRRAGLVISWREASNVRYSLTSPRVAELLACAKSILTGVVAGQAEILEFAATDHGA
ncbi:metalloregulator ArsR/SmtB family transcription factor [Tsukamurella sp. 8F]|uniref:ArsR/SmtB family transcription factor n=1 Tax=unclassified Tsukamurella TaxID=2633480 RepID=UPI0023B9215E|nr:MULTISPECIES: metalloregulator ArsR/SmtB family transcription factor [unclassified Tsukamurella]MDF0530434.1 metalloregulator ArsR/SmtB family transcription factor [Tsukamurella sp. 8J]MDF0587745.1 metalloregulator ArsR/SmtB family transcription factor [Tsukamurella sp. 8F]